MDDVYNRMNLSPSHKQAAFAELLKLLLPSEYGAAPATMTEDEKLRAAYALNLCTVSVSQIIDYNDIYFLEQEYEVILNNLNLEEMPKDEALLRILKQLLDVITYFRIQEGERKMLDKEYQHRMKNAIWNAVPNIGLIVAGGHPITMAISLASQIGIGYMNYRKEKVKIGLEKERKEWELQRSAMEQFNGLRRELFDTAWRLAEKYQFRDSYRLTERQISQYNRILMDSDDQRRYERLLYIKDNFEAYPPFWYYLGSAANAVFQNVGKYGHECSADYKLYAQGAFKKFLEITKRNLLREDQLEASCALELFDLLEDHEKAAKLELLERAKRASGNALDVLELCAISYLKIGETQRAADLFRMLVNEEYNTKVNAQMLSKLYVSQLLAEPSPEIRKAYMTLQLRVGAENLFPMPPSNLSKYMLEDKFIANQKYQLRVSYMRALEAFIGKYYEEYNALCDRKGIIDNAMIALLNRMVDATKPIAPYSAVFSYPIEESITNNRKVLQEMLLEEHGNEGRERAVTFAMLTKEAFKGLARYISNRIDNMESLDMISQNEMDLYQFCYINHLEMDTSVGVKAISPVKKSGFKDALFDAQFKRQQDLVKDREACVNAVRKTISDKPLISNNKRGNVNFLIHGDPGFDDYLKTNDSILREAGVNNFSSVVAVISDRSIGDSDLILSTRVITLIVKRKLQIRLPHSEALKCYSKDGVRLGGSVAFKNELNIDVLREITESIANIYENKQKAMNDDAAYMINAVRGILG